MTAPEVSVIIPAYNAAATLRAQLDALAAQVGAPPFEVLVSDNGSRDATAAIAREYSALPTVTVVDSSARRGPSAARNTGAAQARGSLLAFCDADDVVTAGWLAGMRRALETADAVAGAFEHRHLNSERAAAVSWNTDIPIRLASRPGLPAGASSNLAIRAHVFDALGGFDEALATCEDIDLCWRLQDAGYSMAFAHDAVVHQRKRRGLRATYRQAVSYAEGTVALEAKHRSKLAPAPLPLTRETGPDAGVGKGSRVAQAAVRLRRPDRLSIAADFAWRLGQRRGGRAARG